MIKKFLPAILLFLAFAGNAQTVGIGTNAPNKSARLDVQSTSQGFLPPRLTAAQRDAIQSPAKGLVLYCMDCDGTGELQVYNGKRWTNMMGGTPLGAAVSLPSVTICNTVWTDVNYNGRYYRNGDLIPEVQDNTQWANLTTGAWCWYNNDSVNYSKFGRLYNWYAINDPRGFAPFGWHVATETEWKLMELCLDPSADTTVSVESNIAGGYLKEAGIANWASPNTGATNSVGFTALPGGLRNPNGTFTGVFALGTWFSGTLTKNPNSAEYNWYRRIYYNDTFIEKWSDQKHSGCSVRLVKN
jgi:uncharacterized protein (TIGR02145 family)